MSAPTDAELLAEVRWIQDLLDRNAVPRRYRKELVRKLKLLKSGLRAPGKAVTP